MRSHLLSSSLEMFSQRLLLSTQKEVISNKCDGDIAVSSSTNDFSSPFPPLMELSRGFEADSQSEGMKGNKV